MPRHGGTGWNGALAYINNISRHPGVLINNVIASENSQIGTDKGFQNSGYARNRLFRS